MPRISPSALRQASRISPHAATLLPACRDLPSALNELRWIREHVQQQRASLVKEDPVTAELHVGSLCRRRGTGEPLQYVLGTQPFGNLELKCRPGVLIPRCEPEAYTTHLANLIRYHSLLENLPLPSPSSPPPPLRILDLCTGTGCIALLLYSLLHHTIPNLHIRGVDITSEAVRLSEENVRYNIAKTLLPPSATPPSLAFSQGDIFSDTLLDSWVQPGAAGVGVARWDVLVCNPPYISNWGFTHQTARSVRNYEPKIAQVPMIAYPGNHQPEDVFYARLLDIGARLKPRVMLFEVGDLKQALRVAEMALRHERLLEASDRELQVEVWRDWPDTMPEDDEETSARLCCGSKEVQIKGSGHGRSVFIQCK